MAITVGAVYVDVLPTTKDFVKKMVEKILPGVDEAGEKIGEKLGEAIGRAAGRAAREGIEEGVQDADVESTAGKKGRESGGAFARQFKAEVEAALRSLPDIDIDADPQGALADIAIIREQLQELSRQEIGVDLDAEGALRSIAEIRAELEAIDDTDIDLDFDIRDATRSLGQLEDRIRRSFQDSQGSFARGIRDAIENAVRALPEIDLTADISDVERDIGAIRGLMEDLSRQRIDIDISSADMLREIAGLEAMLAALTGPHTVRVQADLDAARAALARFTEDAGEQGRRVGGAFMERMRTEITRVAGTLPDIQVGADTSEAMALVGRLRASLATLSTRIGVDLDAAGALAELAQLRAVAESLDRDDIDIDVRVDLRAAIAQMLALAAATEVAEAALDDAVGNGAVGKISRFRLILAAVAVLLPLIAGAVVALPAAIALLIGPALAVAAGVDGIKKAFTELKPEIEEIRRVTSAAFEQGLEPTIARLHEALPQLQDEMVETALAVTNIANRISQVATSADNLKAIEQNFDLINAVIRTMGPSLDLLTQNMIRLTTIGLQGAIGWGEMMRQVGENWANVIARLQASGTAEVAVRSLFQVLSELLNLTAGLTEFGAVLFATFGPALGAAIGGLADIFSTLGHTIDSMSAPFRTIASAVVLVSTVMLVLGTRIVAAATAMRVGLVGGLTAVTAAFRLAYTAVVGTTAAFTAAGIAARAGGVALGVLAAAGRTLLAVLGGPVGIVLTAIVIGLSALGTAQADAAAQADMHKAATQELADALKASGGVIDSNVRIMTAQRIEAAGLGDAMRLAGTSTAELTHAVAYGGPVYDSMIERLKGVVAGNTSMSHSGTEVTTSMGEEAVAAQKVLDAIGPMRQSFTDAANQNRLLAEALQLTGQSLITGVGDATRLEEAFATLGNEMSTVKELGDALYMTMIQLSGQAIPLGLAQGQLGQAVRDVAEAFKVYGEAAKNSGVSLLDHTGKINVASEAGLKLTTELDGLAKATYNSATAAFDAAGGTNNLAAAQLAAGREVEFARARFIELVGQFGITGRAAEELADRYGLIPTAVVTQLSTGGLPVVTKDLMQIEQLVNALPKEKIINIGTPSAEVIAQLRAIGVEVTQLKDGSFEIHLKDQAARDALGKLVNDVQHPPGGPTPHPVGADTAPGWKDVGAFTGAVNAAPPAQHPVGINPAPAQQQVPQLQGEIAGQPPAGLPVETNPAAVPPQVADIQAGIQGTVATMPINPIKGSGWDPDLAMIRDSVLLTVATMPINVMRPPDFDAQLEFIRTTISQGAPAMLPLGVMHGPTWPTDLAAITGPLMHPPYTALLITVAKAPTFDMDLQAIKDSINGIAGMPAEGGAAPGALGGIPALLITVGKSPTFEADLQAIKDSINAAVEGAQQGGVGDGAAPISAALQITVAKSPTFEADLQAIKDSINGPAAAGPGGEAVAAAATALLITVAKSPAFDVDLAAIKASINGPVGATLPGAIPGAALGGTPALLITVAKSPMFDIDLAAIKASINGGAAAFPGAIPGAITGMPALLITVAKSPDFDVQLNLIRQSLLLTPAALPVTADINPAITVITNLFNAIMTSVVAFIVVADVNPAIEIVMALLAAIQQSSTFFSVLADTAPAQNMVIELVNWISSLVVPITVIAQFGGFGGFGGMADGGVVGGGGAPPPPPPADQGNDAASAASQQLGGAGGNPKKISDLPPGRPPGVGLFNPDAVLNNNNIDDLRNAVGRIVIAMAAGGAIGKPMAAGIAAVVPPNTWRVIGDRVRDDEAYIPINSAARSHSILQYTAARMGYGLMPQATGSIATQQTGTFLSAETVQSASSSVTTMEPGGGGQGNVYNFPPPPPGATAADLADEVMFRLRHSNHGGIHGRR